MKKRHIVLVLLIAGLVIISAILYWQVNKKVSTEEIKGVLKETVGKPLMFGQFYLEKEDGTKVFLEAENVNLSKFLEKEVLINGYFSERKLHCEPFLQCSAEKYKVFVVTRVANNSKNSKFNVETRNHQNFNQHNEEDFLKCCNKIGFTYVGDNLNGRIEKSCEKDSDCYPFSGYNPNESICGGILYRCDRSECIEIAVELQPSPPCCYKDSQCPSGVCKNNLCVKLSFWQKIINLFKRRFGK